VAPGLGAARRIAAQPYTMQPHLPVFVKVADMRALQRLIKVGHLSEMRGTSW